MRKYMQRLGVASVTFNFQNKIVPLSKNYGTQKNKHRLSPMADRPQNKNSPKPNQGGGARNG